MSYVNEVKKDNVIYDIQDKRLQVTAADAGKMVSVNEQGELTLVPAPSGGTKLYQHEVNLGNSPYPMTVYVVTTIETQISDFSSLMTTVRTSLNATNGTNKILEVIFFGGTSTYSLVYIVDSDTPALAKISLEGRTVVSDTVTEL